jgi:hypothetical protein
MSRYVDDEMHVLVLGGTRFIGPPAVRRLVDLGHDVTILHRGDTEVDLPASVRHLHGDRALLGELARGVSPAPAVVIDMNAYVESDAVTVVDAFRGVARRLVVISSQDVYRAYGRFHQTEVGPLEALPATEDSALRSQDDYEKILVERAPPPRPSCRLPSCACPPSTARATTSTAWPWTYAGWTRRQARDHRTEDSLLAVLGVNPS